MPRGRSVKSIVVVKGKKEVISSGTPFVETIAGIAEKYKISQFTVKMVDKEGNSFEIDLYRPPDLVPVDSTIYIYPYDRPAYVK